MKERKFVTVGTTKIDVEILVDYVVSMNMVESLSDSPLRDFHKARLIYIDDNYLKGGEEHDESNSK